MNLTRRRVVYAVMAIVLLVGAFEAYRGVRFVMDVQAGKSQLLALKSDLDITRLEQSEADVLRRQERLDDARGHLGRAASFVKSDPVVAIAASLPVAGKQVEGLKQLVLAAHDSTETGLKATEVALAFTRYQRDPGRTSIQDALAFLKAQEQPMADVDAGLQRLKQRRDAIEPGLMDTIENARIDLNDAIEKLDGLVTGYKRAEGLLPALLGYDGQKRYLVLPQNDTELFPSGGLISSYGVATFDGGKLVSMDLEYFGQLYDRWQKETGEYVEPPLQLRNYLKRHYSWGLGEAGWYPDFPTTSDLARMFVSKGGVQETDGVIAIDLHFISELLKILGPIPIADYNVTVTAENVSELTLDRTRDEVYEPGKPISKPFLSSMAKEVLSRVFSVPKDKWVDMLKLLDRMGRERHLQLNFVSPSLQALSREYGLDGSLDPHQTTDDFLLIADTSVNSTKLNLITEPKARLDIELQAGGSARNLLNYEVANPLPAWEKGKDPRMVKALFLDGIYGSFLRLYTRTDAAIKDVRVGNQPAGAEQNQEELSKRVFGRFFTVLPGASNSAQFIYQTPDVVREVRPGTYAYSLYLQKQAGTDALPLQLRLLLPKGARLDSATVDGKPVEGASIETTLLHDRRIEIQFSMPGS